MEPFRTHTGKIAVMDADNVDTDRIIPARYLKAVTFDGLGAAAFYDERYEADGSLKGHIMDDPRFQAKGVRVAVVNKNFGCGSSREHAPQALLRWGIKALVGESFADIFFGNCVALGMPCVTASEADIGKLLAAVEADPTQQLVVDVDQLTATYGTLVVPAMLPAGIRNQFLEGTWDATRVLLEATPKIKATAERLPYIGGFAQ